METKTLKQTVRTGTVVGVIPARWASTRLPGKSLIHICGKPLVQWVVESVQRAKMLDDLIVATDDRRILEAVVPLGVKAVMTKPEHPSGTDRVAEAVGEMRAEAVINIQGDEPLIDPGLVDRLAMAILEENRWDMVTAATRIRSARELADPSTVKVVWGDEHQALYFSRSAIPFNRAGEPDVEKTSYWRHLGIYAYRTDFLRKLVRTPPCEPERLERLEQLRALHIGARMLVLETDDEGIGVDTPEDVKYVETLVRERALSPHAS